MGHGAVGEGDGVDQPLTAEADVGEPVDAPGVDPHQHVRVRAEVLGAHPHPGAEPDHLQTEPLEGGAEEQVVLVAVAAPAP